jgi:hypothetical protein
MTPVNCAENWTYKEGIHSQGKLCLQSRDHNVIGSFYFFAKCASLYITSHLNSWQYGNFFLRDSPKFNFKSVRWGLGLESVQLVASPVMV